MWMTFKKGFKTSQRFWQYAVSLRVPCKVRFSPSCTQESCAHPSPARQPWPSPPLPPTLSLPYSYDLDEACVFRERVRVQGMEGREGEGREGKEKGGEEVFALRSVQGRRKEGGRAFPSLPLPSPFPLPFHIGTFEHAHAFRCLNVSFAFEWLVVVEPAHAGDPLVVERTPSPEARRRGFFFRAER